jgi:hypothetical protein
MRPLCALCRHPQRDLIEQEIHDGKLSLREAARAYGLHRTQVRRHMHNHYPLGYDRALPLYRRLTQPVREQPEETPVKNYEAKRDDMSALEKARELHRRVDRVMECAEELGNSAEILRAASELRRIVELEAKLTGEADQPRRPEVIVHFRQFGLTNESKGVQEVRYQQPDPVIALPPGDEIIDAEFEDLSEVMQ